MCVCVVMVAGLQSTQLDSASFEGPGCTVLKGRGGAVGSGSIYPPGWRTGCRAAAAA